MTTYLRGIYTRMPALAPEIEFFFAGADTLRLNHIFGSEPNVHILPLRSASRGRRLLSEYPDLIRRHSIDVAHFQYLAPPQKNCRTVITLHDILFRDFPGLFPARYRFTRNLAFRFTARRADLLTTVSDYSRRRIAHHYGIPEHRILVTPNAVTEGFFEYKSDPERNARFRKENGLRPYILNVGRTEPRKNQLALLDAYLDLELDRRGYDLVFIARPALPVPEFDRRLAAVPEETRRHIRFIDNVDHPGIPLWYSAASLFVFPSLAEGFGIPPIEAAAMRVPVICNSATAMGEYTFLGDNLADLSDPATLRKLIDRNLTSPPGAEELERISRKVCERYNWRASAATLLASLKNF